MARGYGCICTYISSTQDYVSYFQVFFLICLGSKTNARPQEVNFLIDRGSSIEEVIRPEDKKRVLDEFQGKSILYRSLPSFQGKYETKPEQIMIF